MGIFDKLFKKRQVLAEAETENNKIPNGTAMITCMSCYKSTPVSKKDPPLAPHLSASIVKAH